MREARKRLAVNAQVLPLVVDAYLTDERRLFRVTSLAALGEQTLVELEDCSTLDVKLITPAELIPMRLVRVPDWRAAA